MTNNELNELLCECRNTIEVDGHFDAPSFVSVMLFLKGEKPKLRSYTYAPKGYPAFWIFEIDGELYALKEWFNGGYGYAFV